MIRKEAFKILGLKEGASEAEIKKAYRKKALLYHPDVNQNAGADEQFLRIGEAYRCLTENEEEEVLETSFHPKDEERRKNSAHYYQMAQEYRQRKMEEEHLLLMGKLRKLRSGWTNWVISGLAVVLFSYSSVFLFDQFVSSNRMYLKVYGKGISEDHYAVLYMAPNQRAPIGVQDQVWASYAFLPGVLEAEVTPLFRMPKRIESVNMRQTNANAIIQNILYQWFFPFLMLIPAVWLFYKKFNYPMLVLAHCILWVYPFIFVLHIYLSISFRNAMMDATL